MTVAAPVRMDLIIGSVVALTAMSAFLAAAREVRETMALAKAARAEEAKREAKTPTAPPQPVEITVKNDNSHLPVIYTDYGLQRELFDNRAPMEFEIERGDEVKQHPAQYDPAYPLKEGTLETFGLDAEWGHPSIQLQRVDQTMLKLDSAFAEVGGPAPLKRADAPRTAPAIDREGAPKPLQGGTPTPTGGQLSAQRHPSVAKAPAVMAKQ